MLKDVKVRNFKEDGIYTEWGTNSGWPDDGSFMEDYWTDIRIHDNDGNGITHKGPHDSTLVNASIYLNVGYGIKTFNNSVCSSNGLLLVNVHVYACGSHGIIFQSMATGYSVISESNIGQNGGPGGDGIQILHNSVFLTEMFCYNNTGGYGLSFGNDEVSPAACRISGRLDGNLAQINIAVDGGGNVMDISCWNNTDQTTFKEPPAFSTISKWTVTSHGADGQVVVRNMRSATVWKGLPAGTGIANAVENTWNYPVVVYMTGQDGVHLIGVDTYDTTLPGNPGVVYLQPGDKVYFETAAPISWFFHPAL